MKGEKIRLVVSGFIGEREKRRIIEKNHLSNGRSEMVEWKTSKRS